MVTIPPAVHPASQITMKTTAASAAGLSRSLSIKGMGPSVKYAIMHFPSIPSTAISPTAQPQSQSNRKQAPTIRACPETGILARQPSNVWSISMMKLLQEYSIMSTAA
jgi:hypothetical protein